MSELSNYSLLINLKNYNNYNNKKIDGNMSIIIDSSVPEDLSITYNYSSLNYGFITDPDGNSIILSPNDTYNITFNKKNNNLNIISSKNNKDIIEEFAGNTHAPTTPMATSRAPTISVPTIPTKSVSPITNNYMQYSMNKSEIEYEPIDEYLLNQLEMQYEQSSQYLMNEPEMEIQYEPSSQYLMNESEMQYEPSSQYLMNEPEMEIQYEPIDEYLMNQPEMEYQYEPSTQYLMNEPEMQYEPSNQYLMSRTEMEYQPITSDFKAVTKTSTISPINIGDTSIDVLSIKGFKIGMYIEIGNGKNVDKCYVTNFGSILVDRPLKYNHPVNTTIIGYSQSDTSIPSNINLKKSVNIRSNKVLRINSENDILNGLIGSTFRLRVNIPLLNAYSPSSSASKVNYFYLSVEKIDPNCEIINNLQCSNVFVDYKNCTNKKSLENSKKSIYRYVLIPEFLVKNNTSFINNLNFTLEKNNNKLYLKNINTGCYPQVYRDMEKKKMYGELVPSNDSNIDEVFNKLNNKLCNDKSTVEFNKMICDYYSDNNMILFTTNDIMKCSPVTLSPTGDNMISIYINIYNIYGSVTDKLSLIYNTNTSNKNNINNYDYIENVTKENGPQKINMVKFDSSESDELQDNILNFNVEIINFSKEIYKSNVAKTK